MWHCLSGEQFWSGVVPSSSKSSILRRMLVSWTHWPWRWHYDPPKPWEFLIQQNNVTPRTTWIFYRTTPLTYVFITSLWVKALKNNSKHNYLLITQTIWFECSPPMSTHSIQLDVTYSPSLDSFHISQSKGWGKDVDKVGSYCIFSNTNIFLDPRSKACVQSVHNEAVSFQQLSYTYMFQDPRSKACVQSVHSEAVSFQHLSYNHHIPHNTSLHTRGPPCSWHSFWYKAWYTGTANRPFFLYRTLRGLIQSDS